MPRFLVITPVLNCAHYVADTLKSISAQSDGDWVHYLVDGGSTDGTLELLERAVADEPRRRLVTGPDAGLFDALFKGIEAAAADGIVGSDTICVWINGDDLLMPWAFARVRQAFDVTGAEWVTAIPTHWDADGRLAYVSPYFCWYPRWLVRAGQFNGRSLGWMQQESTFFTYGLLSKIDPNAVVAIRKSKLAGDIILWRQFARFTGPVSLMTTVAGFRRHGANLSTKQLDNVYAEIEAGGVWLPPPWMSKYLWKLWQPVAMLGSYRAYRREVNRFSSELL